MIVDKKQILNKLGGFFMKYPRIVAMIVGLSLFSVAYPDYESDRRAANVAYSTAGGAVIGGALGGPRWAAAGAGIGFGAGILANSGRTPEERERDRIYKERRDQGRLESLYNEHDHLLKENKALVAQLHTLDFNVTSIPNNLESRSFGTASDEIRAVKKAIHTFESENRKLKRKVKKLQRENR
jgi:hypothetical protein